MHLHSFFMDITLHYITSNQMHQFQVYHHNIFHRDIHMQEDHKVILDNNKLRKGIE